MSGPRRTVFAVAASVVVLGAVVAGMVALGSPTEQRARRLDQRRLDDLRALRAASSTRGRQASDYRKRWTSYPRDSPQSTRDPETAEPYEYSVRSEKRYQLCATFERDNRAQAERPSAGLDHIHVSIWTHGAGRNCFELEPVATGPPLVQRSGRSFDGGGDGAARAGALASAASDTGRARAVPHPWIASIMRSRMSSRTALKSSGSVVRTKALISTSSDDVPKPMKKMRTVSGITLGCLPTRPRIASSTARSCCGVVS